MKKRPLWLETDLSYSATKDKLIRERHIIGDAQDFEGKFTFSFKDLKDVKFQITTHGKVGVFYPKNLDPKIALEKLKPYLIKADGSPASILSVKFPPQKTSRHEERNIIITLNEPIPIIEALTLMAKYPIKEIRVKKSIWKRFWEWLTESKIPIEF
ncbi:hypothetical protein J7K27_05655 [Candidatus Bathyarchaeota archaeon]|nr:hypothetical protein [Candidatus Bathyarchaeota archaeon]